MHACILYICSKPYTKMAANKTLCRFKVSRKSPELIPPAEPTPYDFKFLSDIDCQKALRCHLPMMNFYKRNPSMEGKDPVQVVRDAIAKSLVFYYPFAGRLVEYSGGKLAVECTGEGVVFVEADADVTLEEFGDDLYPPIPNVEELLRIQSLDGITNSPIFSFQVTRLKCGGFILAYIFNHTMCDGAGIVQFLNAVGEIARGGATPSVLPVWERHLLTARGLPRVSLTHHENEVAESNNRGGGAGKLVRSFFVSAADISALRLSLPPHLRNCSRFEILAGCVWRCRTIALSPKPDEEIGFFFAVNFRKRMNPPLPAGYYGNSVVFPAAVTTALELSKNPLHYAVELVRKATAEASQVRSVEDVMAIRDRSDFTAAAVAEAYLVSDLTHGGFEQADFGWGTAAYGGMAKGIHWTPIEANWYIPFKNTKGESGTVVPICLPLESMEVFVKHLRMTITSARRSSAL